jgi:hypothetical protein
MQNKKQFTALALGLGLSAGILSAGATAAGLSGTGKLICASSGVVGCIAGPSCVQGTAASFDVPTFMFVDFKKKLVTATDAEGVDAESPIKNQEITDKRIILQGVENHRGWSMAIDRVSGEMSLSANGPGVDFMIYGACTAR